MTALIMAKQDKGWCWLKGYRKDTNWEHSWLECDGWAIDASINHAEIAAKPGELPVLISDALFYRKIRKLKITKKRNAQQAKKLILKKGG